MLLLEPRRAEGPGWAVPAGGGLGPWLEAAPLLPFPRQPGRCGLRMPVPLRFAAVFLTAMSLLLTLHPQFLLTIFPVFPLTTPLFPLDSWAFPLLPAVTILSSW